MVEALDFFRQSIYIWYRGEALMTLITNELLEIALSYERPGDQLLRQYSSTVRAMLERVAPIIRNQTIDECAANCWDNQPEYQRTFLRKQKRDEMAVRKAVAEEIRALKRLDHET
jgi:hypothetical protein